MKNFLMCLVAVFVLPLSLMSQPAYQRNPISTNLFMNAPSDGWIPMWNATAGKWSNAVNGNLTWSNVVFVNATANVLTNGILLTNAVKQAGTLASATRPMMVWINPGTYITPTNTNPSVMMGVENVSTYWMPGAEWGSGTEGGDEAYMWDDQAGARTNCNVYGYGRFFQTNAQADVCILTLASKMFFQARSCLATNATTGTAAAFTWLSAASSLTLDISDYISSGRYDAIYGDMGAGQQLHGYVAEIRSKGDLIELGGDSPEWGLVDFRFGRGLPSHSPGQSSFLQMGGRAKVTFSSITVSFTNTSLYAHGTTNGILQGGIIQMPEDGARSAIQDNSGGTAHTGLWLRDVVIIGPTNVDALTLTNISTIPTILENVTIRPGWASTNWARGVTPSGVKIMGGFALDPYKPIGANITAISTNYLPAIRNIGTLVQHGASWFSNAVSVTGGDLSVQGYDLYAGSGFLNSMQITNVLSVPTGSAPTPPGAGDIAFDDNYWGAGRGAFITSDGTVDVVIPAALQSDTPSNGQVLKFNTGGTFTWENDGGSGSTNTPVIAAGTIHNTNTFWNVTTNLGSVTNPVIYADGPSIYHWWPASNSGVTRSGTWGAGTNAVKKILYLHRTNAALNSIVWWTNGIDGLAPFVMTNSTDSGTSETVSMFEIGFNGIREYINSGQVETSTTNKVLLSGSVDGTTITQTAAGVLGTIPPLVIPITAANTTFNSNTVYYVGGADGVSPVASSPSQLRRFIIARTGTLRSGHLQILSSSTSWGSAESWEVRITNLTQTTSVSVGTLGVSNYFRTFSNKALGFAVVSNDVCSVQIIMPTVMTNASSDVQYVSGSFILE